MSKPKVKYPSKPSLNDKDMTVIKVKSSHPQSQGPFVLIEAWKFGKDVHEIYEEPAVKKGGKKLAED